MVKPRKSLLGLRFGKLVVTALAGQDRVTNPNTCPQTLWNCVCDCGGTKKNIRYGQLTQNRTRSCGCIKPGRKKKDT